VNQKMTLYKAITEDILVSVRPIYLDGQSDILARKFVFAYFVRIENHSKDTVQLLRRHWYIHDSSGDIKEVEGEGVIGKQPHLLPGQVHEYNSFCVIETFEGFMEGTYRMSRADGSVFEIKIPRFILRALAN